jgi:hypothetical protein
MPLREWRDVAGSRLSFMTMMSAPFDLARIAYRLHRLNE